MTARHETPQRTPILRMWRGRTRPEDSDRYLDYLERTGVRDLRNTPGNLGVRVLRRVTDEAAEFLVMSVWESIEAIRRFAGPNEENAVYYPEDEAFLFERDPKVTHYALVIDEPGIPVGAGGRIVGSAPGNLDLPSLLLAPPE
jgi:heme-degrading monooxygenase HmoA